MPRKATKGIFLPFSAALWGNWKMVRKMIEGGAREKERMVYFFNFFTFMVFKMIYFRWIKNGNFEILRGRQRKW